MRPVAEFLTLRAREWLSRSMIAALAPGWRLSLAIAVSAETANSPRANSPRKLGLARILARSWLIPGQEIFVFVVKVRFTPGQDPGQACSRRDLAQVAQAR